MKKYRFLEAGERIETGDEAHLMGWGVIHPDDDNLIGYEIDSDDVGFYRRPIPFKGKTAFLVTFSVATRIVLDVDTEDEEELDGALAYAAIRKILANPSEYINNDNIDWERTTEDTECPADSEPIEQVGEYRYLEAGERTVDGDEFSTRDNGWVPITTPGSIVEEITSANKWIRRKISAEPKYRPFRAGDVIEEGDQVYHKGEWRPFFKNVHGEVINVGFVEDGSARKLIK